MAEAGSDNEYILEEVASERDASATPTPSPSPSPSRSPTPSASRPVSAARQRASLGSQKLGLPPFRHTPSPTARLGEHHNLSPRPLSAGSSNVSLFNAPARRFSPAVSDHAFVASGASDLEESVADANTSSSSSGDSLSSFKLGGSPISPAVGAMPSRRRSSSALSPIAASEGEEDEEESQGEGGQGQGADAMAELDAAAGDAYTPFSEEASEKAPSAAAESDRRHRRRRRPRRRSSGSYYDDSDGGRGHRRGRAPQGR